MWPKQEKRNHSQRYWRVWFALHCNSLLPVAQRYPGAPQPSCGCLPCSLFLLSGVVCHSRHPLHCAPTSGPLWSSSRILLPPCPHHSPPWTQTYWEGGANVTFGGRAQCSGWEYGQRYTEDIQRWGADLPKNRPLQCWSTLIPMSLIFL